MASSIPSLRSRHRAIVPATALAVLAAACDEPLAPARPPSLQVQAIAATPAEQAALRELTRAVAMAMGNAGLRNQVRSDMRESRATTEHKLHFGDYLKGKNGGILLTQMARATGLSRDSLQALVAAVRPLEFYMPVAEHRASWRGSDDVIVASAFDDPDTPVGFDVLGTEVPLRVDAPPAAPVLSLVSLETDFSAPLDEQTLRATRRTLRNADDAGGEAIGTFIIEPCAECGGTGGAAAVEDAIYMIAVRLNDAHESWIKGAPELETHMHGPRNAANPQHGEDLTCSGERAGGLRYYNQDRNDFSAAIGYGAPLIADRYDLNQAQAKFPGSGRYYIMWEDDDTPCVTKTDKDMQAEASKAAGAAGAAGAGIKIKGGGWKDAVLTAVVTLFQRFFDASLWKTNDDLVGYLIPKAEAPNFQHVPGSHIVMEGGTYNGNVDLVPVWPTGGNGRSFMASLGADAVVAINQAESRQLAATAYDQYGSVMYGHPIAWRSDNGSVASTSDGGLLRSSTAGTTTIYARACDPECIDRPVEVRVTGPTVSGPWSIAAGESGWVSGSVVHPQQGSYWYEWTVQYCTNGGSCPTPAYSYGSGWSSPDGLSVWMGAYDAWATATLSIYTAPGGTLVGQASHRIEGPNGWPGCGLGFYDDCNTPY